MQYPYSDVLQQIGFNQIIIYSLVTFILSIVVRVFIMLAIGEDAKAIGIKNRKVFLILGISFYIVLFIFSQTMGISIINRLVRFAQEHQRDSGSYSDYFDGYGNNGGYGDFGDFDDYEDFFNNYGNGGETDGFGEFSNGFGN